MDVLGVNECWELIAQRRIGRVAFTENALPVILPVGYTLVGRHLVMRVRREGLAMRLDGQVVAFEVDDYAEDLHSGWSVLVTGTCRLLTGAGELLRTSSVEPSWAGGDHQTAVSITPGVVSGRRIRPPLSRTG